MIFVISGPTTFPSPIKNPG